MRILGIDPGIGRCGWGIIEASGQKLVARSYGCVDTSPKLSNEQRLKEIYNTLTLVIEKYQPEALGIEKLFFGSNVTTAFAVGQARGVVLLLAAQHNLSIGEYTPPQVKTAVTGYGKADKSQIGQMVKVLLKLEKIPKPDDTADALAIAITHAFSYKMNR